MAGLAHGSAGPQNGLRLLRPLGLRRHPAAHPSRAVRAVPGAGGTRGEPDGGDHRQPERQGRGKRGASIDPPGFDAGKTIKGKKRHILVDTQGLLMHALVHSAGVQDRDGEVWVMATLFGLYPFLLKLYADGGYQGPRFQAGLRRACRRITIEIVKRSDQANAATAKGFIVLPKRWIVDPSTGSG